MVDIEFTSYEFKHVVYNWLQAKQSGAINTIEAAKVVERMFNKFGTFFWIGIGRES